MPTLTFMNKNHVLTKEIDMDHQLLFINRCNFTEQDLACVPGTRGTLSGSVPVSKGNVLVSQNVPTFDSSYRTDDESSGITSIRRSSRVSKLSKKLNDFVLDNKVKYDLNRPDIAYSVHCLRQHTHSPLQSHFEAALRVLRYLKSAHGADLFVVIVCLFLEKWCLGRVKKQATLSRSSAEAEYRSMASPFYSNSCKPFYA
nr:hypothetical protein [Tanacetum cinerariifolium]